MIFLSILSPRPSALLRVTLKSWEGLGMRLGRVYTMYAQCHNMIFQENIAQNMYTVFMCNTLYYSGAPL